MQRISWISKLSIQFLTFFIGSKDVAPFFSFNGTYLIDRCPLVCVLQLTHAVFALVISHTITRHSPSRRHRQTFLQRFTNADKNIKKTLNFVEMLNQTIPFDTFKYYIFLLTAFQTCPKLEAVFLNFRTMAHSALFPCPFVFSLCDCSRNDSISDLELRKKPMLRIMINIKTIYKH